MCRENGAGRGARRPRLHPPPRADPGIWIFAREFVNLGVLPSNERPTGSQGVRPPCPTHSPLREEEMERNTPSRYARACVVTTAALLAVTASDLSAQRNARAAAQANPSTVDAALLGGLEWRNIGPNRGGRSIGTAGSTARPMEYYFGATGGGLWKTTDGGTTWDPVTDGQINSASVGAVAVCEANPDVVYIGGRDAAARQHPAGRRRLQVDRRGKTWTHIGLREARNFSRVRIHPTDCNRVFVGAFGEYGIENAERGVYRTTDGGASWQKVLFRDAKTGAVDISIDQTNPNVVYAALWEAFRKPWAMSSGGPGSGLFKSTDGGATWTELSRNPGLPQGMLGKIGVSVSPANPDRVYAIIEADRAACSVPTTPVRPGRMNDERKLRQRAFYYTRIVADPVDADRVYVLNVGFFRSDDGGKTFPTRHHACRTATTTTCGSRPNDNRRMINANDGGGNVSFNGGRELDGTRLPDRADVPHRRHLARALPCLRRAAGQQHGVRADRRGGTTCTPRLYRGAVLLCPGRLRERLRQQRPDQTRHLLLRLLRRRARPLRLRDGAAPFRSTSGRTTRWASRRRTSRSASSGRSRSSSRGRGRNVLYTTSQHVWRSTNEGQSWERISPDLTRADPSTMGPSGRPITRTRRASRPIATVFALAPSRLERDVIWAGTDDGLVQITRDGGAAGRT
jgi:photosystem II stability/assembly factor-like uncharacterized protein